MSYEDHIRRTAVQPYDDLREKIDEWYPHNWNEALTKLVDTHFPNVFGTTLPDYPRDVIGNCNGCEKMGLPGIKWQNCSIIITIRKALS